MNYIIKGNHRLRRFRRKHLCQSVQSVAFIHRLTQIYTDLHRLKEKPQRTQKITEDTEFFLCVPCVSLRLCVPLRLCVIIHRLTQIFTDWMVETADFADFAEKSALICVICGFHPPTTRKARLCGGKMGMVGLEPTRPQRTPDPKSGVSANSTTCPCAANYTMRARKRFHSSARAKIVVAVSTIVAPEAVLM